MGNKESVPLLLKPWDDVDCRKKKRTDKVLFFVAVVSPTFDPKLTEIKFPRNWVYQEREKIAPLLTQEQEAAKKKEQATEEGRENARKRVRETYVQNYKRKKEAWAAAAPPLPSMEEEEEEEGEGGGKNEEEKKAAAEERAQQASRKRRREFRMEEEDEVPTPLLTEAQKKQRQERFDAANTICRPFFRLLYEDTSLDFDAALDQVVRNRKRLLFYKYKKWRIVLYIIDHTLPIQAKYGSYKGSALADLFRPERPFNPDNVSETTRFVTFGGGDADAVNIVSIWKDQVPAEEKITGVLISELRSYYSKMKERVITYDYEKEITKKITKIPIMRGQFVDMQMYHTQRERRRRQKEEEEEEKEKKEEQEEVNPWENESVWFAMQHAATEIQIRTRDTKTQFSPMLVFNLLCASVIGKTLFQNNLNVWFNQILPRVMEIDANIREKFKASTFVQTQAVEDVTFVLCLLSYLSHFQLKLAESILNFQSIFSYFNSQADGRFDMNMGIRSVAPFIVAAAQSVHRNFIMMDPARVHYGLLILDKSYPQHQVISPNKPYCVGANNCHTIAYKCIAEFDFAFSPNDILFEANNVHEVVAKISLELVEALELSNTKNQRACEMANVAIDWSEEEFGGFNAPSPWNDLKYFLSELSFGNPDLVADIVSTVQGIPHQIVRELVTTPSVEKEDEAKRETKNGKKRNATIQAIAKSYLYSNAQTKKQEERLDPYLKEADDDFLFYRDAFKSGKSLPPLEEAISLLQIS